MVYNNQYTGGTGMRHENWDCSIGSSINCQGSACSFLLEGSLNGSRSVASQFSEDREFGKINIKVKSIYLNVTASNNLSWEYFIEEDGYLQTGPKSFTKTTGGSYSGPGICGKHMYIGRYLSSNLFLPKNNYYKLILKSFCKDDAQISWLQGRSVDIRITNSKGKIVGNPISITNGEVQDSIINLKPGKYLIECRPSSSSELVNGSGVDRSFHLDLQLKLNITSSPTPF